jgi:hypothetical protein
LRLTYGRAIKTHSARQALSEIFILFAAPASTVDERLHHALSEHRPCRSCAVRFGAVGEP